VGPEPARVAERALIEAIAAVLGRREGSRVVRWLGDDCAVVRAGGYAAVSVDVMVDGTHFRIGREASAEDAGWRALAGALSDLAAMGAEAGEAYLSVVLPPGFPDEEALALHRGAEALAVRTGVTIAGGDLVSGPALDRRGDRHGLGRLARCAGRPATAPAPASSSG
jgi:thiamine-monophosphate kinase